MIESEVISKNEMKLRSTASIATLIVAILVLLLKFWAFNVSRSQAIFSDALESIVNVITAMIGIMIIYFANQPVDEEHPYGHGKAEYFSAILEGGLITFAAIFVFVEVIKSQISNQPLSDLNSGMTLISIAGLVNMFFGYILKKIGQKYASLALVSAGTHLLVDFWTTVCAIVGILVVKYSGIFWIDRAVAFGLGCYMSYSGINLMRMSFAGLLDAEDPSILEKLAKIFERFAGNGIIQIHHTKVIRSGWFHHIDAHVVVPEFWTIDQAHEVLGVFEEQVIKTYEYGGEANFHLDPCKRKYCKFCNLDDCSVRIEKFEKRMPVVIEHLRSKTEPQENY